MDPLTDAEVTTEKVFHIHDADGLRIYTFKNGKKWGEMDGSFLKALIPDPRQAKPLHVQVAEALGAETDFSAAWGPNGSWIRVPPKDWDGSPIPSEIPHYDTDWSATGPLIERLGFSLHPGHRIDVESHTEDWLALQAGSAGHGPTPLIAVCNLILALHKAGKLP